MLAQYREEADRRAAQGVPPLPLTEEQTAELTRMLTDGHPEQDTLLELLAERVEPGVSRAAKVKAAWLEQVAVGSVSVAGFTPEAAITSSPIWAAATTWPRSSGCWTTSS